MRALPRSPLMLLETLAAGLQASELSQTLRSSIWLYPLVNTGHVVGIALLFGAIVPLDLRLLGCWASVPLDHLARILIPVAIGRAPAGDVDRFAAVRDASARLRRRAAVRHQDGAAVRWRCSTR